MESTAYDKAFKFALRVVRLYDFLVNEQKEYIISKQLMRSGTSIGANIKEALQAQSKKDFLHKMNIALKEASETEYWIELLMETRYNANKKQTQSILDDCRELNKILIAIVKTTKKTLE